MSEPRQPPALLLKTLTVTFGLVTLLLAIVFTVVFYTVRYEVRRSVITSLESMQGLFAALELRRQRDLPGQAATLAENSTLKAALDTYIAEASTSDSAGRRQLLTTITRELEKVAARVRSDAIVAVDMRQTTLAAAGPFAGSWPLGGVVALAPATVASEDGVTRVGEHTFRMLTVPLLVDDERIGSMCLATRLDAHLAQELDSLSRRDDQRARIAAPVLRAMRCANCGAAPAPNSTPKSSGRSRPPFPA